MYDLLIYSLIKFSKHPTIKCRHVSADVGLIEFIFREFLILAIYESMTKFLKSSV
jgi:hypothetical protein